MSTQTTIAKVATIQQKKRAKALAAREVTLKDPPPLPTEQERILLILARLGLIKNEPWIPTNIDLGFKLFSPPTIPEAYSTSQYRAALFCATHKDAPQYLQQAPVLIHCFDNRSTIAPSNYATFEAIQRQLKDRPKLGNFMSSRGFVKGLRKLTPQAVNYIMLPTLRSLTSKLCAFIPPPIDPQVQVAWCQAITHAANHPVDIFEWVCRNFPAHLNNPGIGLREVLDFMRHNHDHRTFNNMHKWSWPQMCNASEEWHREFLNIKDAPIPQVDLTNTTPEDIRFQELLTQAELELESRNMQHCVRSYWTVVKTGEIRIFHISTEKHPNIATLELRRNSLDAWYLAQLKGVRNRKITAPVIHEAIEALITSVNKAFYT